MERRPRILIAADEPLYGRGLRLLVAAAGFDALYVESLTRAQRIVDGPRGDIVLWVSDLLDADGLEQARALRREHPGARLCMLANGAERDGLRRLLAQGCSGIVVVLRQRRPDIAEVTGWLERLVAGDGYVEPDLLDVLLGERDETEDPLGTLSSSEREVLELVAEGLRNRAIARRLWKSEKAIEKSVARLLSKLELGPDACADLDRRVVAAGLYLRHCGVGHAPPADGGMPGARARRAASSSRATAAA